MMTEHEYHFLTARWRPKGLALDENLAYCRNFGWCAGLSVEGFPVLTKRGIKAIKAFRNTT